MESDFQRALERQSVSLRLTEGVEFDVERDI